MRFLRSRFRARVAWSLAAGFALLAGVTCADGGLTGPKAGLRSVVGFIPSFTRAAADVLRDLVAFQIEIDNIHVVLKHPDGSVAKDTVVNVAPGQETITIELTVTLKNVEELMQALVELRDGTVVLFSGVQQVRARQGTPGETPPTIAIDYVGPGAEAVELALAPRDTLILSTDSLRFRPSAIDANEDPVTDLALVWSVKDATRGIVTVEGVFRPLIPRGDTYVMARLPTGVRDSAHIRFLPPASQLLLVSGGGQIGTIGQALGAPFVVEVRGTDNLPLAGVPVGFAVTAGGGQLSVTNASTNANGQASTVLTLGTIAGANTVTATVGALAPLTISAQANPGPAAALQLATTPAATARAGIALAQQPVVQVRDAFGNAVPTAGHQVIASVSAGHTLGGTLTALTNAGGQATFTNLSISGLVGSATLRFTLGETPINVTSSSIAIGAGHARALAMLQQPGATVGSGTPLAPQPHVRLRDGFGNDLGAAGVPVIAALTSADGRTLGGTATVNTNALGVAEFTNLSIVGTSGLASLTFSVADSVSPVTSQAITLSAGAPAVVLPINGGEQGALAGDTLPQLLTVQVNDGGGNPISGTSVTFAIDSGGGSFPGGVTSLQVTTDAGGQASATWIVGSGQQRVSVTASSASAVFRSYVADRVVFVTPPSLTPQNDIPLVQQPVVRLADGAGHFVRREGALIHTYLIPLEPLIDAFITLIGNPVITTNADGIAAFTDLEIRGEVIKDTRLEFYRYDTLTSDNDPAIAPAISGTIELQPGAPTEIIAPLETYRHRVTPPAATITVGARVGDGFNWIPGAAVTFHRLFGQQSCAFAGDSVVTADASGIANVTVNTTGTAASCVIRAFMPDYVGEGMPEVLHRVYIAPTSIAVWTGEGPAGSAVTDNINWLGGVGANASMGAFIPVASIIDRVPRLTDHTTLHSLLLEPGAIMQLAGWTLSLNDSLSAQGAIDTEGGRVSLLGANGRTVNGYVNGLITIGPDGSCPAGSHYRVNGPFSMLELRVFCRLEVPDLHAMSVSGPLTVFSTGLFEQNGGAVIVTGDAGFFGNAYLTSGLLDLQRNFVHQGDGDSRVFNASANHVTRFSGVTSTADSLLLTWDAPPFTSFGSRFGRLDFSTQGDGWVRIFNSQGGGGTVTALDVVVNSTTSLHVPEGFTLATGGLEDMGFTLIPGRVLNNGLITVVGNTTCSLLGALNIPLSCLTPPPVP